MRRNIIQSANCDITCISETHLQQNDTLAVDGFRWYGHNRHSTHHKAPKGSGGVGIFVKDSVFDRYKVRVVDKTIDGIIGLMIEHIETDYTCFVLSCYLSPENSPWGRDSTSFFAHLLSQIYTYAESDAIIVCGDFNSRIGELSDTILNIDSLPPRVVLDKVVNHHGKSLIEFLQESKFCIMNGRVDKDKDAYTCCTARGMSVVDYYLVPQDLLPVCKNFSVKSMVTFLGDHGLQPLLSKRCKMPDHALVCFDLYVNALSQCYDEDDDVPKVITDQGLEVPSMGARKYNYKKANPEFMSSALCRQAMLEVIDMIECNRESQAEIDMIYSCFREKVINEMNLNIPFKDVNLNIKKRYKPMKGFRNEELTGL